MASHTIGRPAYADGVQAVMPAVLAAEERLQATKKDVDTHLAAIGEADSVESLVNQLSPGQACQREPGA
jgi:hypothetical protein